MYQSKRKGTNSGSLESTPGETYPIIEVDAQEAQQVNWVRVKTTYNPSSDRWVSASCGVKSLPWMNHITFACQLLLEYMEANTGLFSDASKLFQSFFIRLSLSKNMAKPISIFCNAL
ncbi:MULTISPECIES: hypothetical protein [Pseudoalteromonas]|uniref:hypothetical protein n=1 Tax=Pseudoalteromonas TaxID=53246 RepID=UPI00057CDD64|nr:MULTISPECIES: hypothetical protein [Pseudoalteromonas]KID33025.1 hypothetical protein QT15_21505 [Pseudoalteromonas flavipulchra NCIMB 2033 = ATCC BAA-314]MBD0781189.1 hypothetical protein [Pseudoalteromonas flavipulchra]MBE0373447.1 hypothetical protein [Pseudoalteromonas flavipulchra NCIMB 2033 = ATCC BAA-314]MBR8841559.1 hypothetical protein [Pseudoalteromonas sp. JC3]UDM61246.1 hypothetical protein KIJ96_15780 [Pseudoalteromonas piscicida]